MLPDELLQSYMEGFYGYGSYEGPYWFVGMEEGGGASLEGVSNRLEAWDKLGRNELEDLAAVHSELGVTRYLRENPKLQATWGKLIRVIFGIEDRPDSLSAAKEFQRSNWGRHDGNNCVTELLPLPSPSVGKWLYCKYSRLPQLKTRQLYVERYAEQRARHLRQRVQEHRPATVVFYSMNGWYRQSWNMIAGVDFEGSRIGRARYYIGNNDRTVFAIVNHPVARGIGNDYYRQVGALIASRLAELSE